jgi:glycerophosphoryl diester phosphodiesterase
MRRKDRNKRPFDFADYPLLFGHRGCSKAAPENTLASFKKLLENKIPGLELDVQLCASGEIVVFHDLNIKRITGMDALVSELSLEEIKKLDAGSWFDKSFAGEKIPTLDEVFELLGENVYYDIEIKHKRRKHGDLEKKLVEKIHQWNFQNRVIISSFNPVAVLGIRESDPLLNTAVIYTNWKELPWYLHTGGGKYICKPNILKPTRHKINPFSMFLNKKIQGYSVVTWTEDDPVKAEKFINLGVDGIVTNVPEDMLDMVSKQWHG